MTGTWFHALLNLTYGFMMFEQVYGFDERDKRFHLRKLAPRMPGSISEIAVARDGGLEYIRQYPSGVSGGLGQSRVGLLSGLQSPSIGVDRLVAYVNDQEAGNWFGTSYLRALFKHFLRKIACSGSMPSTASATARVFRLPTHRRAPARSRSANWVR
jgi:hypothetical protein